MAGASHFGDQAWWPLQGSRAVCDIRSSVTRVGRGQVLWQQGGPGSGCPCLPLHAVDAACFFHPSSSCPQTLLALLVLVLYVGTGITGEHCGALWREEPRAHRVGSVICSWLHTTGISTAGLLPSFSSPWDGQPNVFQLLLLYLGKRWCSYLLLTF